MSRYSVGTGNPNGGAAGRCHKRPKEPRGESAGPSPRPGGPAQRDIFAHLTTAVGSSGKDSFRGSIEERQRPTCSFVRSLARFLALVSRRLVRATCCTLLIALCFSDESTFCGNGSTTSGFVPRSHAYARHGRIHQDREVTCHECQ